MRIRTGSTEATSQLAGYLRRCECIVALVDEWTLDLGVKLGSLSEQHAELELRAYLRVWEALNPEVFIERLDLRPAAT